jgi:hypothetical protein
MGEQSYQEFTDKGGSMAENFEVCKVIHKSIDEKFDLNEKRLNDYIKRIDVLEQSQARTEENLKGLVNELSGLNTTLRWFIGAMVGSFISFFFYAVQQGVF